MRFVDHHSIGSGDRVFSHRYRRALQQEIPLISDRQLRKKIDGLRRLERKCFAARSRFAFYGYLASQPELTPATFRTAMFYGGVMGSFAVERFGTERLQAVTQEEIDARFRLFREISHLDHVEA